MESIFSLNNCNIFPHWIGSVPVLQSSDVEQFFGIIQLNNVPNYTLSEIWSRTGSCKNWRK